MQNLIYYPTFEVVNEKWLKYALLYIDNFNPIIPREGDNYLSDTFHMLQSETDLINIHRPTNSEGDHATIRAIREVEHILEHPYRFANIFNSPNIVREWQNKESWDNEIFEAKYSYQWKNFCLSNNLAERSYNGLKMSGKLALLYMTILAKEVAFSRNASVITDFEEYNDYSIYSQTTSLRVDDQIDFAKGIINLKIPNLDQIDLSRLVEFRNENRGLLRQFNHQLEKFYDKISEGENPEKFVQNFNSVYNEIKENFLTLGVSLVSVSLGAYILLNNTTSTNADYLKQLAEGTGFGITAYYALNNFYKKTKSERFCRKYLTKLGNIR